MIALCNGIKVGVKGSSIACIGSTFRRVAITYHQATFFAAATEFSMGFLRFAENSHRVKMAWLMVEGSWMQGASWCMQPLHLQIHSKKQ